MDEPGDRKLLSTYAAEKKPRDIWTSPACTAFTPVQNINKAKFRRAGRRTTRPAGEKTALDLLSYLRGLYKAQQKRGGRSHHEQSATSRGPCGGDEWPWGISSNYEEHSTSVAGCAVGLLDKEGEKLLAKHWRIESNCGELLAAMAPYKCAALCPPQPS